MTLDWTDLEGVSLAGRYWLKQCLSATADEAWYLTRFGTAGDAAVRVIRAHAPYAGECFEAWREALAIEHPHILRMLDAGRAEAGGTDLIYAVFEYPDDFLTSALTERPLSGDEAREVLGACLSALTFLHSNGLVHGALAADRIMAVGQQIKLPCDTIRHAGTRLPSLDAEADGAPEVAGGGGVTPAADMWSLGATLVEILTRQRPAAGRGHAPVPEPFVTIVQHTLRENPAERWSAAEVESYMHPPVAPEPPVAAPLPPPVAAEPQPIEAAAPVEDVPPPAPARPRIQRPARHGYAMKWLPLAGTLVAVALGALFLPHAKQPAAAPPAASTPAPAKAPEPVRPPQRPPNFIPAHETESRTNRSAVWRVVVYEYGSRAAAEREVRRLNTKRPAWHAQVFTPQGAHPPYFVALGGSMTLPDAQRLRNEARAAGLPRDTFVRNFAR